VGEDGPTHHGSFDLSYLRLVPGLVVMAPKDENELRDMLWTAIRYRKGPIALRFPRGESLGLPPKTEFNEIPIGKSVTIREGKDMAILAIGDRVVPSIALAEKLEENGISARVINARFIKPLDTDMMDEVIRGYSTVVTVENNTIIGGFGSAVAEVFSERASDKIQFRRFGLPDRFVPHGKYSDLFKDTGLDIESLSREILSLAHSNNQKRKSKFSLRIKAGK